MPPAVDLVCPAKFASTTNRTLGIRVDGFDNVNILNGRITGFEYGIIVKNAAGVRINNIEADNNAFNALSVGDFDGVLPSARGGVPNLVVNGVNFHDNRNDAIGVSPDSSMSMKNSHVVDNCASGIFVAPLSFDPPSPAGTPQANANIEHSNFVGNFRSAVNFWGATGSVEHSLIDGNNADTSFSDGSDFGQISLTNLEGGDIGIRCNDIRDSLDANGNTIERAIGFRGSFATTAVEVTRNLLDNNPVAIHFSTSGAFVTVDIHQNTFDSNTTDFELDNGTWTVDADKNFYVSGGPTVVNAGSALTTAPVLRNAQHCRAAVGVQ